MTRRVDGTGLWKVIAPGPAGLLAAASILTALAAAPAAAQSRLDGLVDACRGYADEAVRQNQINQRRNCGLSGPGWSSDRVGHFRWCVSAPQAARQRESRARADGLRGCRGSAPRPSVCTREYRPVCGARNGDRKTYPNACEARRAGARIVGEGPCRSRSTDPGPGGGRACVLRDARISVSSPGCGPKSLRLDFGRERLRDGEAVTKAVDSGTIGAGHGPWGVCNFQSRIRYVCRDGRLRIQRIYVCRQARTDVASATCRVSN